MRPPRSVAREISYASSARTRAGRAVIRSLENITGRLRLIRMARDYDVEVAAGRDFWEVMVERYGLSLEVIGGSLDNIPATGPLMVISNHPYGILDGLMLGHILARTRGDFRILAHRVFRKAAELDRVILPISFDETREAQATNIETRAAGARLSRQRRLHRHLPRRHGLHRAEAVRPADGSVLAALHRAADRQVGGHGGAGVLRGPQQPALPDRQPPALHPAHGAPGQRVQGPRRRAGEGGDRPAARSGRARRPCRRRAGADGLPARRDLPAVADARSPISATASSSRTRARPCPSASSTAASAA